jgi:hypothetical protein
MCIYARIDFRAPAVEVLTWIHRIRIQDSSKLDLDLNSPIQVKHPVYTIFVIGGSEYVRDNEFATAGYCDAIIPEVGVFEQNPSVFFVDADGVLDGGRSASPVDKRRVHIMDRTLLVRDLTW